MAAPDDHRLKYESAYQAALERLRRERPAEAFASYLDGDNLAAAQRFLKSEEFEATWRLLRDAGLPEGGALLDLGAGNGIASFAFACKGLRVTAADPCAGADYGVGVIPELARAAGAPISAVVCWAEALPFPDASFDAVYARQCLHHAADLDRMHREVARVLKPGGLFLAVREHVVSNDAELRRFQAEHLMRQMGVPEQAYPLAAYLDAMRRAGLQPVKRLGPHAFPINLDRYSIRLIAADTEKKLAGLVGAKAARLAAGLLEKAVTRRAAGWALDRVRRRPGRLCTILAAKRLHHKGALRPLRQAHGKLRSGQAKRTKDGFSG